MIDSGHELNDASEAAAMDIEVERSIEAAPRMVYDAWFDTAQPGGPWFGCERVIITPQVGGLFHHSVRHENRSWAHYGRFVRLEPPDLIVQTWVSEATGGVETLLELTFTPEGARTRMSLRHTDVPDDPMGRRHEEGWGYVLDSLSARFTPSN